MAPAIPALAVPAYAAPAVSVSAAPSARDSYMQAYQKIARPTRARLSRMSLLQKAKVVAPCVEVLEGYYCGVLGFRDDRPNYSDLLRASKYGRFAPLGDQPFAALVRQRSTMKTSVRLAVQDDEYELTAEDLAKHEAIDAVLARVEAGLPVGSTDVESPEPPATLRLDDPDGPSAYIMNGKQTRQVESNWCGPATMQMLDWADDGTKQTQQYWANQLGRTPA